MGRVLRLAWCFFIGFLLGAWGVSAHASYGNWGRSVNVNYPGVSAGARNPSWNSGPIYDFPGAPDGWGKMRDINRLNLGGRAIDLAGTRLFSPAALAAGAIALAKKAGPIGLGLTLADLVWDEVSKQWMTVDGYPAPAPGRAWYTTLGAATTCTSTAKCTFNDAMEHAINDHCLALPSQRDQCTLVTQPYWTSGDVNNPAATLFYKIKISWRYIPNGSINYIEPSIVGTPAGSPPEETLRPATDAELEDAIYVELVARGMGSDLARRLVEAGYTPAVDSIEASGPSSVPGGSTTTTVSSDAGTTTITTTTNYNITYSGDTANITETTTTTKTNPDSTTETTTETKSPAEGDAAAPEEQPGLCDQYPDSIACQEMDTPAEEKPADTEIPVSLTPSGGFGAESGSCPADVSLVLGGYPVTWSYAGPCQFFSAVRPAVIAVAWIAAVLIALGAYRKGD